MPSVNKTSRREHSEREIGAILALHAKGYSVQEIDDETDVPKLTITKIIRRAIKSLDGWYHYKKRPGRPPAFNTRAYRRLIRYVDQNPKETLFTLCTPLKSGTLLSRTITRKYL
jgi:transposase